jgi:hypothetical protein
MRVVRIANFDLVTFTYAGELEVEPSVVDVYGVQAW